MNDLEYAAAAIATAAEVAHEANRVYCRSLGDDSQVAWINAPEWQQASVFKGVEAILANPLILPEGLHESWTKQKLEEGWIYGAVKDAAAKTHPCLVPYAELPAEQRFKDALFSAVVHAALGIPIA